MKIIIASDSFKGCMTSKEACNHIKKGIIKANPQHDIICLPMADGGEGTAQVLSEYANAIPVKVQTMDLYRNPIEASYGWNEKEKLAIIDVASCIGLNLYPKEKRNPMVATSQGVGIMIQDAINRQCKKIIIGLGGSGTNDGGMGILKAFGAIFYDRNRQELQDFPYSLEKIAYIDKRNFNIPKDIEWIVACDVKNHLYGSEGATYTFGKQKGLYLSQMKEVDDAMHHYNKKIEQTFHVNMNQLEGSGAAGGIGAVLLGVFKAKMIPGIQLAIQYSGLEEMVSSADLVITGEGQTDRQTLYGKVPFGIANVAKAHNVPAICLSGALGLGYEELYNHGMIGIFSSSDRAMEFKVALKYGAEKLENLAFSITKLLDGWRR